MKKTLSVVFFAAMAPYSTLANEVEMLGNTVYSQEPSPFSQSGFNNAAGLRFDANIGDSGALVFRCVDNNFLSYLNPLGDGQDVASMQRLGAPNANVNIRLSVGGQIQSVEAIVSPTGLSLTGDELAQFALELMELPDDSEFAFSFQGATGEVIFAQFLITAEDKSAFLRVASNCGF